MLKKIPRFHAHLPVICFPLYIKHDIQLPQMVCNGSRVTLKNTVKEHCGGPYFYAAATCKT